MSMSVLETITSYFTPDVISKASSGHTDNTGDATSNVTLSQNRANAVRDMLVNGEVSADRMTTAGYGQDRPIAFNDTEEGKARNRRTELVVLKR